MFLVNSRLGLFSATPFNSCSLCTHLLRALLLPKLRGHFAEFLNESSSARLRILFSPTCVGLRYGHLRLARGFSWQRECTCFGTAIFPPRHRSAFPCADLPAQEPYGLDRRFHPSAVLPSCVPPSLVTDYGGTGMSTCCPSTTPFGLALGPDLP